MKVTDKILETATQIPGLNLTGTVVFNDGSEAPLYEMKEETAEGWNRSAEKLFLRYFSEEYGEDPKNKSAAFDAYSEALRENLGRSGAFKIALAAAKKAVDTSKTK